MLWVDIMRRQPSGSRALAWAAHRCRGELPQRSVTAPRLTQYVALEWARMPGLRVGIGSSTDVGDIRRRISIETEIKYLGQRLRISHVTNRFV